MAALLACGASAQEAPPDEPLIVRRAREAAALLREDPAWPDGLFDDAFRRNVPAAAARAILAIEPGTTDPPDVFPYQGYKGGRLAGIVSRAYLVRAEGGASFAVAGIWNDGRKDPDEALFARMATRALQLLAREP